jgi:predicted ferric reductase
VGRYLALDAVQILVLGLVVAGAVALFYLRVGRPFAASGRAYRLREARAERGGATTLALEAIDHPGATFSPGQFAWLKLGDAPYALTEHPFSYSSSAARPGTPEFTLKAVGDFTEGVRELTPGSPVVLDGPHGSFRPPRPAAGYLLIAGGIGITPVMSLLRTLADADDRRPLTLIYANRSWEEVTFREELDGLRGRLDLRVIHVLSDPPAGWTGESGRLGAELLERALPPDALERNHFVCGPPAMVDFVVAELARLGVDAGSVHAERFAGV